MEDKVSGNTAVEAAESNVAVTKKASKSKVKSQQKKISSRPPTSEMVTAAIKELKDRKGSSFQAIKKYVVSTYKVDGEKVAPFIKRYLKTAVSAGALVQTKGKGATGSFKLSTDKPKPTKSKGKAQRALSNSRVFADAKKDAQAEKAPRKPAAAKKTTTAKKAAASPKKPAAQKAVAKTTGKKGKAATESKSPSKAKKTVKAPAAKTKTPKPKKAKTVKAAKK
ncbi:PREDICTED: late histone H1-like [Cyphomyrmex costatus]|uniref:Histone H1 n=1 Tax=Cyphomyrmex costatus TaxID=456900 RepID=A0A195CLA0_9HYME|nr:PREDICTED: late histone H1-like [Cyphomyrmex costatus]KYN01478.1 Histone H1 [Cyphomyrmex costatus]